jgi:TIR domain-containing protein
VTDVFLSYSSKDRGGKDEKGAPRPDRVSPVVKLLEDQGFNVFWDQKVPVGEDWDTWIRQKLKDANCAIALWSENSITSTPVRQEAKIAHKQGKLISVLIDPIEVDDLPMGLYTE